MSLIMFFYEQAHSNICNVWLEYKQQKRANFRVKLIILLCFANIYHSIFGEVLEDELEDRQVENEANWQD